MITKYATYIIVLAIVTVHASCSYIADSIEAELTTRASFSISAQYEAGTVIVRWDANPITDSFAGYEIYMTQEPNNEFADMIVVGARYDIGSLYFKKDSSLSYVSTNSFIHTSLPPQGIYFYRVGIITWEERDYDNDGKKEKKPDSPNQVLYESYTSIDEISGSAIVYIP